MPVTALKSLINHPALRRSTTMKSAAVQAPSKIQHILFATDFSSAAASAVPYVKKLAKHYEADIFAFHVRPPVVNPMTRPATWSVDLEFAKMQDQEHRRQLLETFNGIPTKVLIEEGDIAAELKNAIEKNSVDLVVLGTHGRSSIGKLLLGSIAEEIFRTTECPVLTVGPHSEAIRDSKGEIREILFATDFASESKAPAAYAVSLAQEFQARLVMLHVIPEAKAGDLVSAHDVTEASQELLRKLVPAEAQAWCKPEYLVQHGNPAETILKIAQARESDLIVLGVKKEAGVPGASTHLPIATAHKVVSRAVCPVLTVRS
jgi:nucleotide-binding universal stress UspA family protein